MTYLILSERLYCQATPILDEYAQRRVAAKHSSTFFSIRTEEIVLLSQHGDKLSG
jgi:hypothetical protein